MPGLSQNKTWIVPSDSAETFAQRIVLYPLIDIQNKQLKAMIEMNKIQCESKLDSTTKALKKQIPSKNKVAKTFRATKNILAIIGLAFLIF